MTKQNLTDITIVLDASTSMQGSAEKTRSAINEFIKGQQDTQGECNISLFTFSAPGNLFRGYDQKLVENTTWLNPVWEGMNIKEISRLSKENYQPCGNTALYDATGIIINKTGERFRNLKEENRPSKVLFVIMTDGEENSSREFTLSKLKDMITHQENVYSWNFLFLGADFSTTEQTIAMGLDVDRSFNFSKMNMVASYKGLSKAVSEYRTDASGCGPKLSRGFARTAKTYADAESN